MPREVTPKSALENLKREAKRWLKALRENTEDARARLQRALPNPPELPTLRDVQHALAREHGLEGWTALKNKLVGNAAATPPALDYVARFSVNACPDHRIRGGPAHVRAWHTAMRILTRRPEIARDSLYTAIVCGDVAEVERVLAARPEAANEKGGPNGWEPLLYLCFTRLPLAASNDNAVAIARALLDRGADPNVFFMAGDSRYTPLVGAIGEGEEDRPPHPQRDALVQLLLDRGAEPYDIQVVYNIHFHGRVLWFLKVIYEHSIKLGRKGDWDDPAWPMLDMGGYGNGARWHVGMAVKNNDLELAEWVLAHGASPEPASARHPKKATTRTLHEDALRAGHTDMAELFVRHGATPSTYVPSVEDRFAAACFRLDRGEARALVAGHPELMRPTDVIFAAARQDRVDVVAFLLDLGMSPDIQDRDKHRPLHMAAYEDSINVAQLLIARGAEIDAVASTWQNTPLGAAAYSMSHRVIALLSRYSRDIWELTLLGKVERLREILRTEPSLARIQSGGHTPLMWLPDDEQRATEIVELFLSLGAEPSITNEKGQTAADVAEQRGMFDVAALLRSRTTRPAAAAAPAPAAMPLRHTIEQLERVAEDILTTYRTGDAEAMQRVQDHAARSFTLEQFRMGVEQNVGKAASAGTGIAPISLDDARLLVARWNGFPTWGAAADQSTAPAVTTSSATSDAFDVDWHTNTVNLRRSLTAREADALVAVMNEMRIPNLNANWNMTNAALERISHVEHLASLNLNQSRSLTDAGVAHLARCEHLARVELAGTQTGDGAIKALTGKHQLRHFKSGRRVTDAGLALFHQYPPFKTWQGGEPSVGMLSADAGPTYLHLRGSFTDRGLADLVGLDGLFALNVDDGDLAITPAGLEPLIDLAHLGWLGFDATDVAMRYIAEMPCLRFLMCQDTLAGDDGFTALSRSPSIEYIWGRRCYNLGARGFAAMSAMPALRGLSVSCKNVDDAGLAALPRFPSLREFMPMDVPDAGFRHVGQCAQLEALECMYVLTMTDAATEHIGGLRLKSFRAWSTRITDRSLEILGRMSSLERLTFENIPGITNAGLAALASLPHLGEISLEMVPGITPEGAAIFPPTVRVRYSP